MNRIRKGDTVVIITGRDKGRTGTVIRVLEGDRVLVENVNMVKRHTRPNPQRGTQGGIVEKAGSWYSYAGERIGQGREAARKFLKDNPETMGRISQAVYELKGVKRKVPAVKAPDPLRVVS